MKPEDLTYLRLEYATSREGVEAPDPRLVALLDSYEHHVALAETVRALLPDLRAAEDGSCTVCGADTLAHETDCPAPAVAAALARVSGRRVPGRPAGQRIAENPTAEARELLGLDVAPDRAALLSLYHDDATALLDRALQAQHEPEGLHLVHAALVEALADAHTDGREPGVSTTVPDETLQAIEAALLDTLEAVDRRAEINRKLSTCSGPSPEFEAAMDAERVAADAWFAALTAWREAGYPRASVATTVPDETVEVSRG